MGYGLNLQERWHYYLAGKYHFLYKLTLLGVSSPLGFPQASSLSCKVIILESWSVGQFFALSQLFSQSLLLEKRLNTSFWWCGLPYSKWKSHFLQVLRLAQLFLIFLINTTILQPLQNKCNFCNFNKMNSTFPTFHLDCNKEVQHCCLGHQQHVYLRRILTVTQTDPIRN